GFRGGNDRSGDGKENIRRDLGIHLSLLVEQALDGIADIVDLLRILKEHRIEDELQERPVRIRIRKLLVRAHDHVITVADVDKVYRLLRCEHLRNDDETPFVLAGRDLLESGLTPLCGRRFGLYFLDDGKLRLSMEVIERICYEVAGRRQQLFRGLRLIELYVLIQIARNA